MLSRESIITSLVVMLDEGFGDDIVAKIAWLGALEYEINRLIDTYTELSVNDNYLEGIDVD